MKKIVLTLLIITLICSLTGCTSNCKVAGCDEKVSSDGLCAKHALEESLYKYNKTKKELDALYEQYNKNQELIDKYYGN